MADRTLTKEWLKKAFLKTLWESTRSGGKLTGTSHGVDQILHRYQSSLAFLFQLKNQDPNVHSQWSLTDEERRLALQGVEELQRDGFIMNDPDQGNDNFKVLTEKGLRGAAHELAEMKLSSVDIENILSRDDLLNRVRNDFLNEEYESAIFKAYKQVEEAVRAKAGQTAAVTGHDLMVAAFNPNRGVLKSPEAQTPAEEQAFFLLFDSAHGWFRNPVGHRTVGYQDAKEAAQILGLANLLLDMLDRCVTR
jgi:uncharacterized protein (TIGR02391 family)